MSGTLLVGRTRSVQPHQLVVAHRVAAGQDLGRPRIGPASVGFLLFGHGHDPKREDLVDLGGVEEVAGALRRDRRVVAQHDGRDQHGVRRPSSSATITGQQRCCTHADVSAAAQSAAVEQRDEPGAVRADQQVGAHERIPRGDVAGGPAGDLAGRPHGTVVDAGTEHEQPRIRPGPTRQGDAAVQRPASAHQPADQLPVLAQLLDVLPAGAARRASDSPTRRPAVRSSKGRDLAGHRLVEGGSSEVPSTEQLVDRAATRPVSPPLHDAATAPAGSARHTSDGCARPRLEDAPRPDIEVSSPAPASAAPARPEDAELPAHLVLRASRAVGVEQVALVEHGVGDLAGARSTWARVTTRSPSAAASRSAMVCSQAT